MKPLKLTLLPLLTLSLLFSPIHSIQAQSSTSEPVATEEVVTTPEALVTAEPVPDGVNVTIENQSPLASDTSESNFSLWSFLIGALTTGAGFIVGLGTLAKVILSSPVLLKIVQGMVENVPAEFAAKALEGAKGLRDIADVTEKIFHPDSEPTGGNG